MGAGRCLGQGSPHAGDGGSGAGGAGGLALGGDPRQPDRQDSGSKGGFKGYDAGKRIHGRKRHILTDTNGRLLAVQVHAADIQDRDGAKGVLGRSRARFPFVERVFADGGYAGKLVAWARNKTHITLEVVRRLPFMTSFVVLRRRWVVERTDPWIMKCRRLVRDYEQLTGLAETPITIAASATLIPRWP